MAEQNDKTTPNPQAPEELAPVQIQPISKSAGGVPAITSALKSALTEMGVVRTTRTLLKLNQKAASIVPVVPGPSPMANVRMPSFAKTARSTSPTKRQRNASRRNFLRLERRRSRRHNRITGWASKDELRIRWCCVAVRLITKPISWDDAFALIAAELNSLNHPDEAIFYTSGRTSNEAAFLYQLFVQTVWHQQSS